MQLPLPTVQRPTARAARQFGDRRPALAVAGDVVRSLAELDTHG